MRFDTSQHMKLGQHMKLAPRMIQSMEILQMPLTELEERIEQELESNIALEVVEPGAAGETSEREGAAADTTDQRKPGDDAGEFDRLGDFAESDPEAAENAFDEGPSRDNAPSQPMDDWRSPRAAAGETDAKAEAMANTQARGASSSEQLLDQWRLVDVDDHLLPLGELLIGYIEDDGYIRTPLKEVADNAPASMKPVSAEDLARALQAVQLLLEPVGIGARDVRECLLLQADAAIDEATTQASRTLWERVRLLIEHHLDDIAQNRLPKVAEKTGLSIDEVKHAVEQMRVFHLAPGRQLYQPPAEAVVPDAIVEFDADADRYIAYLNDSRLPNLQVNREYALMARDTGVEKTTRDFIKTNLSNATWLIDAVEQRRRTLLRVIRAVIDHQRDFFDFGPTALRPLPMTQVAEQLGVHVATVSRAVADKHLLTPRGVVKLRDFFTGGTQTAAGEEMSWDAVKAALGELVEAEDKKKPLSDEALSKALADRGIDIARRTVAKYRDQLGIPSARLRKQH